MTIVCPSCGKTFDSIGEKTAYGMHRKYVHNPNSAFQISLRRKRAFSAFVKSLKVGDKIRYREQEQFVERGVERQWKTGTITDTKLRLDECRHRTLGIDGERLDIRFYEFAKTDGKEASI